MEGQPPRSGADRQREPKPGGDCHGVRRFAEDLQGVAGEPSVDGWGWNPHCTLVAFLPLAVASDPSLPYAGELGRKALHLLALSIPLGMWWVGMPLALYLLAPAALIAVAADVVRSYSATFNVLIRWIFGPLMRPEELPEAGTEVRFNGATCVLVGAVLMVLLFPLRVAVPVLAMAMLADAAAALVGRRVGRVHWGSLPATVEGTTAFIGTGLAIMACFPAVAFGPAAAGVVVGAVVEVLPMPVNDNIRVPVVAALVVVGAEALLFGRPVPLFAGLLS